MMIAIEFFDDIIEIHQKENLTYNEKYIKFRFLLERICAELTKNNRIQLTTLFSKIDYLSNKHKISKKERWQLNNLRVNANNTIKQKKEISSGEYYFAIKILSYSISTFYNTSIPNILQQLFHKATEPKYNKQFIGDKIDKIRVTIDKIDFDKEIIYCQDENKIYGDYGNIIVKYNVENINTEYNSSIQLFKEGQQLNLLDIIYKDDIFKPKFIVLEPDYLLDVSAVSECFKTISKQEINSPFYYFINKFKEKPLTEPIHLGNIANYILDELINEDTEKDLNTIIKNSFKEYPVEYTYLFPDDEKLKTFLYNGEKTVKNHYFNLKSVVDNDLQTENIDIDNVMLEPAFISENFGIQGRLDLFEKGKNRLNIIELKSGSLPFPHGTPLSSNHQSQVILYKLIVSKIYKQIQKINAGICYSKAIPPNNIRYVDTFESLERKIINLRNNIVAKEHLLADGNSLQVKNLIENIKKETVFPKDILDMVADNPIKMKWLIRDFVYFTDILNSISEIEKKYFCEFIQFVAKEQQQNKLLLSKLWNKTDNHEENKFETIENLTIKENKISTKEQIVIFKKEDTTDEQDINFRKGDICIVFPKENNSNTVLDNQIVKGSIKKITRDEVVVYFKYKQRIDTYFKTYKTWSIEHDYIDYSFSTMNKSLFSFLKAVPQKRKLILGERKPHKYFFEKDNGQALKQIIRETYNKNKKILLLANSSTTVDFICDIVNNSIIDFDNLNNSSINYGRSDRNFVVDSQLNVSRQHLHNLHKNITPDNISKHKIFISIMPLIADKTSSFANIEFDTVIVDEISQTLSVEDIILLQQFPEYILLGKKLPAVSSQNEDLSKEQNKVIAKALLSKDYFLLLGPPGSGKTSIIIKHLSKELYHQNKNILLLAYTNRAVDEICDAVNNAINSNSQNFIRIGSELGTQKAHRNNLLKNIAKGVNSRKELSDIIKKQYIYTSTVSSILSKPHILKIKKFDVVIIDEASQILEPQILEILHKIPKFILIGDHKQLPAISLQEKELSKVSDPELNKLGLINKRNAYFERIYNLCKKNNWKHAFDKLTFQGRMHPEIALFPKHLFYENELKPVPLQHQKEELFYNTVLSKNPLEKILSKNRLIFIPSRKNKNDKTDKINSYEAQMVAKIISSLINLYKKNKKTFSKDKTIGIITPYRNQIAKIKSELEKNKIPNFEDISVDTVERYQGSQRDIIILSFSINEYYQIEKLVNFVDDKKREIDRKLNVAITRAREQLIFIGNEQILSNEKLYFKLIEFVKTKGGYIREGIINALDNNFIVPDINLEQTVSDKVFIPDSQFKELFEELVIDKIRNHERTTDYPNTILGEQNDYIRNIVIEYGRANFDQSITNFKPEDRVDLYCFFNMRKHYFSSYAIFETYSDFFTNELKKSENRIFFIDFGSGPLTSGLAFNQYFATKIKDFSFNYIGLDISNAMLEKAKQFSKSELFSKNTKFEFVKYFSEISEEIRLEISKTSNCIILNFSYLFANLSQKQSVKLAENIKQFKQLYPLNNFIIIYQNASSDRRNRNYYLFKKQFDYLTEKASKREIVSYKNKQQSFYDKTENVFYEILSL